jgi:DNA (cytosine-5)-methyltransferase 1
VNVLDLFSGIGGFSLGLERAGMRTVAFCEIEPYCRAVLRKHWPNVPIYEDVRNLTADQLRADGIIPDVICGGFPCQDISDAGKRVGIEGARSGLWHEYARLIGEVAPAWVIIENVPALRARGLDTVLRQLASLGRDAEWHCIPASAVGALHARDRAWIIAYPERNRIQGRSIVAAAWKGKPRAEQFSGLLLPSLRDAVSAARIFRADHGVQSRVDVHRNRALGNTVYPQIPQIIGEAIMGRIADLRAWQDEADFTWTHTGPFGDVD